MKFTYCSLLFGFVLPMLAIGQDEKPQAIERACPKVFQIRNNNKVYSLRYASNHPIETPNHQIKHLVVYVHGARRNGLDYYEWGEKAVKTANANTETLLIAPQFTSEKDLDDHKHDDRHLFWVNNNWRIGDESVSSKNRTFSETFSSFALMDSVIVRVCNRSIFPKLKTVTIIGHSAGGQFVSRYVGATPIPNTLKKYQFKFIVMNPSTYMYLDNRRPVKTEKGLVYAIPDTSGCKTYNAYPRGLEKLNPYTSKMGEERIKSQLLSRDLVFLLGEMDVNINDSSLDKTCGANLQGRFRLERGQFFYEYLQLFADKKKVHQMEIVPQVAHDGDKMVNSKAALWHLFKYR